MRVLVLGSDGRAHALAWTLDNSASVDEVVAMSNDNEYGLAAAVWINDSQPAPTEMPWGGYKQSGIGRELGKHGVEDFLESKSVYLNLG